MITVISKHLCLFNERQPIGDEEFLGAIHYIEQIRYKGNQFRYLCCSSINAPVGFISGIDIEREELNYLYRHMIIWFELESFIKSGKSFLDHFWRIVTQNHPELVSDPNLKKQKYILTAFNEFKSKDHKFKDSKIYEVIDNSLEIWGRYLIGFRNYIEYTEPLAGIISTPVGKIEMKVVNSVTTTDIILPDRFPKYGENGKHFLFSFNEGIRISELIATIIDDIDTIFPLVILEIHRFNKAIRQNLG